MRVLAIDPGEKRIGLAISDPTGTLAKPHSILKHSARETDAKNIALLAKNHTCDLILIGQALDDQGRVGYRARSAIRLGEAIRQCTPIPVLMWDESGTTRAAKRTQIESGMAKRKRQKALDDLAAAILLQDFLASDVFQTLTTESNHGKI